MGSRLDANCIIKVALVDDGAAYVLVLAMVFGRSCGSYDDHLQQDTAIHNTASVPTSSRHQTGSAGIESCPIGPSS